MSWQRVHLNDVAASPWRNGGGVTRELLAWPDAQDWMWRLSVADVAHSGLFSHFAGVQRWFSVLGPGAVHLTVGEQAHLLNRHSAPLCFDGETPTDCALLEGATQDFNLMVRQPQVSARMTRVSGAVRLTLDTPKTVAIYAVDAMTTVQSGEHTMALAANTLVWQALPAGTALQLSGPNFLWMEMALRA
jgi:uncharacterized protein